MCKYIDDKTGKCKLLQLSRCIFTDYPDGEDYLECTESRIYGNIHGMPKTAYRY